MGRILQSNKVFDYHRKWWRVSIQFNRLQNRRMGQSVRVYVLWLERLLLFTKYDNVKETAQF